MQGRRRTSSWRQFNQRDRGAIESQLAHGSGACCPCGGGPLEARPGTRLAAVLPGGVRGTDLDCRACRRFHPRIRHTPHSLYMLRLRRLAAAVLRA